ncbi:MAG TPA: hypothetical protein PLM34_12315 [Lentimicrobium sp.]|nr:hypothetical protein [Lentimicrobium sp.]
MAEEQLSQQDEKKNDVEKRGKLEKCGGFDKICKQKKECGNHQPDELFDGEIDRTRMGGTVDQDDSDGRKKEQ